VDINHLFPLILHKTLIFAHFAANWVKGQISFADLLSFAVTIRYSNRNSLFSLLGTAESADSTSIAGIRFVA
jgi:hypothetical protein